MLVSLIMVVMREGRSKKKSMFVVEDSEKSQGEEETFLKTKIK